MLIIKHTITTTASVEDIWKLLSEVNSWPTWDHDLEYSSIDGPFQSGTTGKLKFKSGPLLQTKLIKVEPMKSFTQEAKIALSRVIMSHYVTEHYSKTTVTFQTEICGPMAFIWALLIGRSIKKKIPIEMSAMVKIAESLGKDKMS